MSLTQHIPLVLASSSPRRKAYLEQFGLQFTCHPPHIDETRWSQESPVAFVRRMALEKAETVRASLKSRALILAGDTDVCLGEAVLGKPQNADHALEMLQQLRGQEHAVYSGYCLLQHPEHRVLVGDVCTTVRLRHLPDAWLRWYVSTGEPLDKAGAYSIQGLGTALVESIQGSYNNVVGYPIEIILEQLLQNGWISFSDERPSSHLQNS